MLRQADADLVLVDTAGRSPKIESQLRELFAFTRQVPDLECHLVLPATHAPEVLQDMYRRFAPFKPRRLVISKVDEAEGLGAAVELARRTGVPISYATTGQGVPEDIVTATPDWLAGGLVETGNALRPERRTSTVDGHRAPAAAGEVSP